MNPTETEDWLIITKSRVFLLWYLVLFGSDGQSRTLFTFPLEHKKKHGIRYYNSSLQREREEFGERVVNIFPLLLSLYNKDRAGGLRQYISEFCQLNLTISLGCTWIGKRQNRDISVTALNLWWLS